MAINNKYTLVSPYYSVKVKTEKDLFTVKLSWGTSNKATKQKYEEHLRINGVYAEEMATASGYPSIMFDVPIGHTALLDDIDVSKRRQLDHRHNGHRYCQITNLKYDLAYQSEHDLLDWISDKATLAVIKSKINSIKNHIGLSRQNFLFCSIPANDYAESGIIYVIPSILCHLNYPDQSLESETHFIQTITVASIENGSFANDVFDNTILLHKNDDDNIAKTMRMFDIMRHFIRVEAHSLQYNKVFSDWLDNRNREDLNDSSAVVFELIDMFPPQTTNGEWIYLMRQGTCTFAASANYFMRVDT
jgi:hypothetical protein